MTEKEQNELNTALAETLKHVESTVSWAEARGFTDTQEYLIWESRINQLSVKDHNIEFFNFKYTD